MGLYDCCANCTFFHIISKSEYNPEDRYFCREKRTLITDPKGICSEHIDKNTKWYDP